MKKTIILGSLFLFSLVALTGCDKFLDVEPDNRTNVDSAQKVRDLLVNAYSQFHPVFLFEHRTDNYMDNGPLYSPGGANVRRNYFWESVEETDINENSQGIWQGYYSAIANANLALQSIEELGTTPDLLPYKGEALLARAYSHFVLATIYCQAYSPSTADSELGIPYITEIERTIDAKYERGTLAETYAAIEKDLLEGLPLIEDDAYTIPSYHFNMRAANSFAAKFYLYKEDFSKAKAYADKALGENAASFLFDYNNITETVGADLESWTTEFTRYDRPSNFLIIPVIDSFFYDSAMAPRYGHSEEIASGQTFSSKGPWSTSGPEGAVTGLPVFQPLLVGESYSQRTARYYLFLEYTDRIAGIGYAHAVYMPFNGNETLLYRAEAETMLGAYDEAAADLKLWYESFGAPAKPYTKEDISAYYQAVTDASLPVVKPLHPKFALEEGMQTNMIQAVLHARRIDTFETGQRWEDIKRYGIEITHNVVGGEPMTLTVNDHRRAIPIPTILVTAGVEQNPGY